MAPETEAKPLARRRLILKTSGHLLRELGAVYRLAVRERMAWQDARAAAAILAAMRSLMEASGFEERLAALEAALAQRDHPYPRPNGGGDHREIRS